MRSLIVTVCLLFVVTINGQDDKKPILIDEFGAINCEDLLARTDNFGLSLKEKNFASGYVVTYRNGEDASKLDWQVRFIHRALISRLGNQLTVTILRKIDSEKARTEFWLVPSGTNFAVPSAEVLLQIPFKIHKRILFANDDTGPCSGHVPRGFVEMFKSDTSLTGYVVNINDSNRERANSTMYFIDFFRENSIADRGIRIYFKKKKLLGDYSYGYTEYWLMPKKN